jgi:hypothetical protein
MTDNDPISWRAIVYGMPVLASDGTKMGIIKEVLGSDEEDIFHGVRVAVDGHKDVMLLAEDISGLTTGAVTAALTPADFHALPDYEETADYHIGTVGRFRKHLGWKQDSHSDEEPG